MSILSVDQISPIGSGTTITLTSTETKTGNIITVGTGASVFSPAGNTLALGTNNTERLRITNAGAFGLSGTNYGSSGQVLTSAGSGSAPTWSAIPSQVTINNASGNRVITSDGGTTLNCENTLMYDGTNFLIGTSTEAPYNNRNLTVAAGGSGSTTVAIEVRSPTNGTGRIIFSDGTSADSSANEGQVIYQQSDHKMLFGVAANYQNMALESTGGTGANLNLIDGNLKFASGHGIDFSSASGSASGSASALMDDYEEGTWTATLSGNSSPANVATNNPTTTRAVTGTYRKIGSLVHVQALWTSLHQGQANDMANHQLQHITGIPFTSGNASGTSVFTAPLGYSRGIYGRYSNSIIEECVLYFWLGTASTTVYMQASQIVQNSPGTLFHTVSNSSSSMYYAFNMTYHTN